MNTKIILSLGTSVLLASSLLAFSPQSDGKQGNSSSCKQNKMMKHHKDGKGRDHGLLKMFKKLDLSDAQRTEIRTIVKTSMQSIPNPHTAFSDEGFNKEQFVKLAKEKRDTRVEHRAATIEKVYNVLSSAQKKDFKTMLDMRDIMKKSHKSKKSCS